MPSRKDRREYFRERRKALAENEDWKKREAERKARWYDSKKKASPSRPVLSDEEKAEKRRIYDRDRRRRIAEDKEAHEKEKARKRSSYHRNKNEA